MDEYESFRVLSFDCYGTLIDWETGILGELAPWAARHDIDATGEELLGLHAANETVVETEHPSMRYPDVLGLVLDRIADRYGVRATPEDRQAFGDSVPRWPAFPDSADALARLHERFALVILSNVDRQSFAASNERLGVQFDAIVTAEDVGSYKPAPANFDALLAAVAGLGIERDQLLHVAESLYHDHEPARAIGLASVWIHRRHGQAGFGATPEPRDPSTRPERRFPSMAAFADAALATRP